MSDSRMKNSPLRAKRCAGAGIRLGLYPVAAAIGLSLLSGCAARDHVIVGAIPDDYRTNHPIVISEKEQVTDIPVGAADRGVTRSQREQLEGFLSSYDRSAAPVVQILLPQGSANEAAARRAAAGLAGVARSSGVPRGRITILSYSVNAPDSQPPIRVSYSKVVASAGPCGRWPEDLMKNSENKHYADFGCSYQRNLAAQVANPNDLIGPRKMGDIDATNRNNVINVYRSRGVSPEFQSSSEVDY
ncbi:MAG: CpaD family pilus assembly protein [Rhizobiaceae bacterium]